MKRGLLFRLWSKSPFPPFHLKDPDDPRRSSLNRIAWCTFLCGFVVLGVALLRVTWSVGAEPTAEPTAPAAVAAAEDSPQVGWGRITRAERKLARQIRNDAAEVMKMGRMKFVRALRAEEKAQENNPQVATPCLDQLKLTLLECDEAAALGFLNERTGEIDIERFKEILQMILDFLKQLFAFFQMVADTPDMILPDANAAYLACIAPEALPAPGQAKPDQVKPGQTKSDRCRRTPVRKIIKAAVASPVKAVKAKVRRGKFRRAGRAARAAGCCCVT